MVTDKTSPITHHDRTVALIVSTSNPAGGIAWYSGTMTPDEFKEAISRSIEKMKLFRQIASPSSADYLLSTELTYAGSHPGFNMHAWVKANWSLVERPTGTKVWSKDVTGNGLATVGDAFGGAARQYMAIERAGKDNIDAALTEVSNLHLEVP